MKRILIVLFFLTLSIFFECYGNGIIHYSSSSEASAAFAIDNFRFNVPNSYKIIATNEIGEPGYIASQIRSKVSTNSYDGSIETNYIDSVALGHWDFYEWDEENLPSEITSGSLQISDLETIDNILSDMAAELYFGNPDEFEYFGTNDLLVIDGVIVKSFFHIGGYAYGFDIDDVQVPFSGVFFLALDRNNLACFWSDYETRLSMDASIEYDAMTMHQRISSSTPISQYIGITNAYGFNKNNKNWEDHFSQNTILVSNLNDQISTLQAEVSDLVAYTNDSTQLQIINDIVSTYQSQIDTLEDELDAIYVYTNRMTMSEAQAAMRDLRVGSQTFDVSNGTATIRMYVDESSDLTSSWTNTQHVLEVDIPADQDTMFYRFRMD